MLDLKHCSGCEDDFYNDRNPYGVKECWHRKDAKLQKYRLVHINQPPPYLKIRLQELPTCYRRAQFTKVGEKDLDSKGYWKAF